MRWLLFSIVLCANYTFSQTAQPKELIRVEASPGKSETIDSADRTDQSTNAVPKDTAQTSQENPKAKSSAKTEEDGVDKDSMGYKIGYQIGSWLIPGILMILVSIMIYRRSRSKEDRPEF